MSETSEYIMGQVRSMARIQDNMIAAGKAGKAKEVWSMMQQQKQEFQFLLRMLQRHPPHRLEVKP